MQQAMQMRDAACRQQSTGVAKAGGIQKEMQDYPVHAVPMSMQCMACIDYSDSYPPIAI